MGFKYTPYLDDYIQYKLYPTIENPFKNILWGGAGVLFTRPLAGLFDFFIWSLFGENLGIAVLIISILYALSGILFYKALTFCNIKLTPIFLVFYILLPLNIEGTYWLSASSRIVPPLLFSALSCICLIKNKRLLFFVFCLLSMFFYEQAALFSFTVVTIFILILPDSKKTNLFVPLFCIALLCLYYFSFGKFSDNSSRISIISPHDFFSHTAIVLKNISQVLFFVHPKIISMGFLRGLIQIIKDHSYLWFFSLLVLSVISFFIAKLFHFPTDMQKKKLIIGIILSFSPLLLFFLIPQSSLNLRNFALSIVGFSIIIDALFSLIPHKYMPFFVSLFIFCFIVCDVSETYDYEYTARTDFNIAQKIAEKVSPDTKELTLEGNFTIYHPQNSPFGDHIMSMLGSDWGPTGIVRTLSGNRVVNIIILNID